MVIRAVEPELSSWRSSNHRKPLIISGARQVGKSYLVRNRLSPQFRSYVELNFEEQPAYANCFLPDLIPTEVLRRIELQSGQRITPGETLLFSTRRNFAPTVSQRFVIFTKDSALHVIAAGSLLDFGFGQYIRSSRPREFSSLNTLSFEEYLLNSGNEIVLEQLEESTFDQPFHPALHQKALKLLKEYLAIGGMPEVVRRFVDSRDYLEAEELQRDILETYENDFPKYTRRSAEYRYTQTVFSQAPRLVGQQFKFTQISRGIKSNYLRDGVDLLRKASVIDLIYSAKNAPLAVNYRPERYKLLFVRRRSYATSVFTGHSSLVRKESLQLMNSGAIAEQFVGQQIMAHANFKRAKLFYWQREKRGSSAKIDYLLEHNGIVYPIEVKAGAAGSLKSLWFYLQQHSDTPHGIRVSTGTYAKKTNYCQFQVTRLEHGSRWLEPAKS